MRIKKGLNQSQHSLDLHPTAAIAKAPSIMRHATPTPTGGDAYHHSQWSIQHNGHQVVWLLVQSILRNSWNTVRMPIPTCPESHASIPLDHRSMSDSIYCKQRHAIFGAIVNPC
jgi:hypothetical protein